MKTIIQTTLVVCILLIALISTSCGTQGMASTPTTQPKIFESITPTQTVLPTITQTFQSTSGGDDVKNAVIQALLALTTQANRMDVTTVLKDGTSQVSSIEFVPPDRKHILDVTSGIEYLIVNDKV
jgi:hypothetical protein